jgi:hypothetical protein
VISGKKTAAVNSIQLGQEWRSEEDGRDHLVTKVATKSISQYAMLRPAAWPVTEN